MVFDRPLFGMAVIISAVIVLIIVLSGGAGTLAAVGGFIAAFICLVAVVYVLLYRFEAYIMGD